MVLAARSGLLWCSARARADTEAQDEVRGHGHVIGVFLVCPVPGSHSQGNYSGKLFSVPHASLSCVPSHIVGGVHVGPRSHKRLDRRLPAGLRTRGGAYSKEKLLLVGNMPDLEYGAGLRDEG